LVYTVGPTECSLQGTIGTHAGIDLDQADPTGQDVDETIQLFVERRILTNLLFDLDICLDHWSDAKSEDMHTERDRTLKPGKFDRLCHDDRSLS
jgi:hypothetical protein